LAAIASDLSISLSPAIVQVVPECQVMWTPFSYFFSSLCPNPAPSVQHVHSVLQQLYATNPPQSFLLPASVCILDTVKGVYVGFSVATPPKYRAATYKAIYQGMPKPLQQVVSQWLTHSPKNEFDAATDGTGDWLQQYLSETVRTAFVYQLNWNSPQLSTFLAPHGLCTTCASVFRALLHKQINPHRVSSANYLLHCAEWEAVVHLVSSNEQ
jgi:hypothetical protein